jgi:Fe2+ or Zn2+ uptake regulation protein
MTTKPSDTNILGLLSSRRGMVMPTYFIKNLLREHSPGLQTPWVLRRLKALEKAGYVQRAPTTYATMICWELVAQLPTQQADDSQAAPPAPTNKDKP